MRRDGMRQHAEDHVMRRQHALGAAREDVERALGVLAKQQLQRLGQIPARIVVDEAVAFGLAEHRDDPLRIDVAPLDQLRERGDIARIAHRQPVHGGVHQIPCSGSLLK